MKEFELFDFVPSVDFVEQAFEFNLNMPKMITYTTIRVFMC